MPLPLGGPNTTPLPTGGVRSSPQTRPHPVITPDELPEFLEVLNKHEFTKSMRKRIMLRLMMVVFMGTSELTETLWSEIDFQNEVWIILWCRVKTGKRKVNPRKVDHYVHLPRQEWMLPRELHTLTGRREYLFPNRNEWPGPTSNFGILAALKCMGYARRMTGHCCRALTMSVLHDNESSHAFLPLAPPSHAPVVRALMPTSERRLLSPFVRFRSRAPTRSSVMCSIRWPSAS